MDALKRELKQLGAILTDAARLLWWHWPSLIVIYCAGFALRFAALWVAGRASHISGVLTALVLPLAPLFTIAALALMLRILASSLPGLLSGNKPERWRSQIKAIVVVLIPFLAIYSSNGFLKEDLQRYAYDQADEVWAQIGRADYADGVLFDRIPIPSTGLILGIVLIAVVLRKIIAWRKLASRSTLWGLTAAYLEALWLTSLAYAFTSQIGRLQQWVMNRQVVDNLHTWWTTASETWTAVNTIILGPITWLGAMLSSAGAIVVVPVAWITIGATVFGAQLKKGRALFDEEVAIARINRLPSPAKRALHHVISPALTPVKAAVDALRKIALAGLIPMVIFCLLFALTGWMRVGVDYVAHLLIGPRPSNLVFALEPIITLVDSLVYFVVTLALLAAGVSRVLTGQGAAGVADRQNTTA